jgi:hypothetical protein
MKVLLYDNPMRRCAHGLTESRLNQDSSRSPPEKRESPRLAGAFRCA